MVTDARVTYCHATLIKKGRKKGMQSDCLQLEQLRVKSLAQELGQVQYFGRILCVSLDDVLFTFAAQILPAGEGIRS